MAGWAADGWRPGGGVGGWLGRTVDGWLGGGRLATEWAAEQLADAGADADATKGIGSVLSGLFPAIGPVLRTISPRPPSFPVPPNGVSSPRHFRRYFDPSSSLGDLGDHTIQAGLKEVLEDQPGYVWSMMAFYDLEQAVPCDSTPPRMHGALRDSCELSPD